MGKKVGFRYHQREKLNPITFELAISNSATLSSNFWLQWTLWTVICSTIMANWLTDIVIMMINTTPFKTFLWYSNRNKHFSTEDERVIFKNARFLARLRDENENIASQSSWKIYFWRKLVEEWIQSMTHGMYPSSLPVRSISANSERMQ